MEMISEEEYKKAKTNLLFVHNTRRAHLFHIRAEGPQSV